MKLRTFLLTIALLLFFVSPAFATSVGVHMHNEPGSTAVSEGVMADISSPDPSDVITSITIDGYMQPGDRCWIVYQSYDQWEPNPGNYDSWVTKEEVTSFPYTTTSNNYFRFWLEVQTASTSTGCTLVYVTSITNSNGYTTTFDPMYCDVAEPPPEEPPPPPALPPPPAIPGAPTYNVSPPSLPDSGVSIPGPRSFDGTYNYQEPEREGPYTYTPPPLNIPDPIPSPPPPPEGPGLFDFSSIMQPLGTPDEQRQVDQPIEKSIPRTPDAPITPDTPMNPEAPIAGQPPVSKDSPVPRETPGTVDPPSMDPPAAREPALQPEAPLPVQPAEVQPAVREEPRTMNNPLQPDPPLGPEEPMVPNSS